MSNVNVNQTPKFDFPVSRIVINNDPKFGEITNVIVDFVDRYGNIRSKIYFLSKDIERLFNYSRIKTIISRLPLENKLLLRPLNLKGNNLRPLKISNRGTLMIDMIGLNRIIMRSNLPAAVEYQDWIYDEVLPQLWTYGFYINPTKVNYMIKRLFCNTLYNYNPSGIDDPIVIDMNEIDKYAYLVNSNNYTIIDSNIEIKSRIFNIAFLKYTGSPFISLSKNNDVMVDNPFIIAFDIGGPELVKAIYLYIEGILVDMHLGFTLEEIEHGNINPDHSLFNINKGGSKYREYQESKNKTKIIDIDKPNREYRKEQKTKKYGINPDEVVDK